ncbi:MAG TPA: MarR family winged helix-turn-helix transcriptional regulator [Solirubrobacterales bacterium]|nr:MarR family winged helix-turn-helix transcriptional regulator [Solirubrobacterales bacterium]
MKSIKTHDKKRTTEGDGFPVTEHSAFLLARLGRLAARRLNQQLAEAGLKPPQAAILIMLRDHGPLSQQELAERLRVDPSNLVIFLNALEEAGSLVRRRDPADRRRHIVEITKQGSERVPACYGPVDALEEELFGSLSAEDRERLHALLTEVLANTSLEEPATDDE